MAWLERIPSQSHKNSATEEPYNARVRLSSTHMEVDLLGRHSRIFKKNQAHSEYTEGAEEMAWSIEYVSCKQEDSSVDLQNLHEQHAGDTCLEP